MCRNLKLSVVCPLLMNNIKQMKSTEAHNGSKWHYLRSENQNLLKAEVSRLHCHLSAADSRSSCTETRQKALWHITNSIYYMQSLLFFGGGGGGFLGVGILCLFGVLGGGGDGPGGGVGVGLFFCH